MDKTDILALVEYGNSWLNSIPCIGNLYKTEDADVERQIFREVGA